MKKWKSISFLMMMLLGTCFSNIVVAQAGDNDRTNSDPLVTTYADEINDVNEFYTTTNYDVTGLKGDALLEQLAELMEVKHRYYNTYAELRSGLAYSDEDPNNTSNIILFYAGESFSNLWGEGNNYNREHVWPKDLSNGLYKKTDNSDRGAGADIHHLRPADPSINSTRSNYPYTDLNKSGTEIKYNGNGTGNYYKDSKFEPRNGIKGDVARILMYMYTHYSSSITANANRANVSNSKTTSKTGALDITSVVYTTKGTENAAFDLLLEWNELDPVDDFEMNRNNYCTAVTGTRNPFIDHPEFATMIWDDTYVGNGALCDEGKDVEVQSISITPSNINISVGSLQSLQVTYKPSNALNKSVTWSTSNNEIATVDDGLVRGISEGTATITAATTNGKTASCLVTVSSTSGGDSKEDNIPANTVKYTVESKSSVTTSGISPEGTSASYLQTYNTKSQITANNSATLTLSGFKGYQITDIVLNMKSNQSKGSGFVTVKAGSTTLYSIPNQSFAEWTGSFSSEYIDVNLDNIAEYTIKENENLVITINASANSLYIASYSLTYKYISSILVSSVTLNEHSLDIYLGDSRTLTATVLPENATDKTVAWSSSNDDIVTVNNGMITGIKEGSAIITATSGDKTDSCLVTVNKKSEVVVNGNKTYYQLVKNVSELKVNETYVIASYGFDVALSQTQNPNNRGQVNINKKTDVNSYLYTDNLIQELTLENGNVNNTYAFNTGSGYLYAASSSNNYLKTETSLSINSSWSISINEDGIATIISKGTNTRNTLKYNKSSSLFACYASGQEDVAIYKVSDANKIIDSWLEMHSESSSSFCDYISTNNKILTDLIKDYDNLDTFGKDIVDNADDISNDYGTCKIGHSIEYAKARLTFLENNQSNVGNTLVNVISLRSIVPLLVILLGLITICIYYFTNKRKYVR